MLDGRVPLSQAARAVSSAVAGIAVAAYATQPLSAQPVPGPQRHIEIAAIAPRPEDVATIDGIIKASYETISGPAGQPRQWGRDRTLYHDGAYFVETGVDPRADTLVSHGMTYQEYVDEAGPALEHSGYFEREIGRVVRVFGHVASAMSAWEARISADGRVIGRGVNSIQLVNDGKRWWITSINWDGETSTNPIPRELLRAVARDTTG